MTEPSDGDLAAAQWNADNPLGTPVMYWPLPDGSGRITRTRSVAWTLGDGTPVVMVDGVTGGVALSRVEAMAPHVAAALMED